MSENQDETNQKANESKNSEEGALPVKVEIEEFDKRIKNVEKIVDMVKNLSDRAFEFGTDYLLKKTEVESKQLVVEDTQHKRTVRTLIFLVSVIFLFCTIALFLHEIDLIKIVLQSSLAVAAGVGLSSLWKGYQRKKSK
ncbi:MAG: hypothetical protein A2057_06025 [Ignavibacteria bacterium GWA2_35_9]|nr:MAG: hypothetical protein A2057_06025 [Ignavibacteria bacterium GWA2_35_9]OGU49746.1 MAG: hypothetical protein A2080_10615 [Ignavibacteria bacterium GWC2_36_12]